MGINSLISRRLGAKRFEEADLTASHGYRLAFISWIPFLIIGLFLARPLMNMMSGTPYIVEAGSVYLSIVMIGSIMVIAMLSYIGLGVQPPQFPCCAVFLAVSPTSSWTRC